MNLDHELEQALRREAAPAGFAAKVMARTRSAPPWWRRPAVLALAAGIAAAAVIPTAVTEYRRQREMGAANAARELLTALSVTNSKLQHAKEQLRRNTRTRQ